MSYKPGQGGRPKGAQNKVTAVLKRAILKAFDEVGAQEYLVTVAKTDPRTFCMLLAKLIPTLAEVELAAASDLAERLQAARARLHATPIPMPDKIKSPRQFAS